MLPAIGTHWAPSLLNRYFLSAASFAVALSVTLRAASSAFLWSSFTLSRSRSALASASLFSWVSWSCLSFWIKEVCSTFSAVTEVGSNDSIGFSGSIFATSFFAFVTADSSEDKSDFSSSGVSFIPWLSNWIFKFKKDAFAPSERPAGRPLKGWSSLVWSIGFLSPPWLGHLAPTAWWYQSPSIFWSR